MEESYTSNNPAAITRVLKSIQKEHSSDLLACLFIFANSSLNTSSSP